MATDSSPPPATVVFTLGGLLRGWRERVLLTQDQLARATGLGVRTIRRLESGAVRRPHGDSLRRLADALGLTGFERTELINAARSAGVESLPARYGVPRQLPPDVAGFTGRVAHLRHLDALLAQTGPPTPIVITAMAETAGIGKTALAVHWAHRVADRFPDGQLFVDLRGFGPSGTVPVTPTTAVRGFLTALHVPAEQIPAQPVEQAALYRSLLARRRVLVVLDNAADVEQVRPLLPAARGCLAVVTSRSQLTGLVAAEGARPLALDLLSLAEGRQGRPPAGSGCDAGTRRLHRRHADSSPVR